jgi:hypothetical protein
MMCIDMFVAILDVQVVVTSLPTMNNKYVIALTPDDRINGRSRVLFCAATGRLQ